MSEYAYAGQDGRLRYASRPVRYVDTSTARRPMRPVVVEVRNQSPPPQPAAHRYRAGPSQSFWPRPHQRAANGPHQQPQRRQPQSHTQGRDRIYGPQQPQEWQSRPRLRERYSLRPKRTAFEADVPPHPPAPGNEVPLRPVTFAQERLYMPHIETAAYEPPAESESEYDLDDEETTGSHRPPRSGYDGEERTFDADTQQPRREDLVRDVQIIPYGIGDFDAYAEFRFDCPKPEPFKNGDSSDFDSPSLNHDPSSAEAHLPPEDTRIKPIYQSTYTGDAETGGNHSAMLTEIHRGSGELFKWLHIQQDVMNFDEFWAEISRCVRTSDAERRAINRLRADITRLCVKSRPNPKGENVGYLEPRFMQMPVDPAKKKLGSDDAPSAMLRWFCMPFFVLKQYSGLLAGTSLGSFPSQTLMQAQFSRTTQQRDMGQAVCELGIAEKGECFHIEQLWCLVLGDGKFIRIDRLSYDTNKNDRPISYLWQHVKRKFAGKHDKAQHRAVQKSICSSITGTNSCEIWIIFELELQPRAMSNLKFIWHFTAFWPMNLEFKKGDSVLTAEDWPKLLKYLRTSRRKTVVLNLTVKTIPAPARTLPEEDQADIPAVKESNAKGNFEPLHTLTLIVQRNEMEKQPANLTIDIQQQLKSADEFLREQPSYSTQTAYKECPEASRATVLERLRLGYARVQEEKSDARRLQHEDGIELFNAADTLFQLFLPLACTGPTTTKFWGTISDLACGFGEQPGDDSWRREESATGARELSSRLRNLFPRIVAFQAIMSYMPKEDRLKLEAPREFVTAWLHIITGLVLCQAQDSGWTMHFTFVGEKLMRSGMDKMVQTQQTYDLLDSVVLQPADIASLAVLKLNQDRASQAGDINEVYSQYLASLDNDIATKPSDRSYQHRIDLVRRELSAVRNTVAQQRYVVANMRQTIYRNALAEFFRSSDDGNYMPRTQVYNRYWAGSESGDAFNNKNGFVNEKTFATYNDVGEENLYNDGNDFANENFEKNGDDIRNDNFYNNDNASLDYSVKVSPTDKNGFRGLLLSENSRLLEQRDFEFRRYVDYVDDLERTIAFKMEWTKDRQENAVYAFTIVTIIFLPLSSIAGIFGMNTSDVRDMNYSQWLFWVVALPVTLAVIIIGLWWMNELGNVVRWLTGQQSSVSASGNTGYGGVTAEPAEVLYYEDAEEKPGRLERIRSRYESPFQSYGPRRSEMRQRPVRRP